MTKKMNKYKNYVILCRKLSDAKENNYIYESLFIERLIIEDRLSSILKHLKVSYNDYANVSLKEKLKLISKQKDSRAQSLFTKQLLIELKDWEYRFDQYLKTISNRTFDGRKLIALQKESDRIRKKIDLISKKFA